MTSKLTREQAQKIIDAADAVMSALAGTNDEVHKDDTDKMIGLWDDLNDRYAPPEVVRNLASMALAAMDSEPVAWTWQYREQWHVTSDPRRAEFVAKDGDVAVLPLYRHAQPAPVVPDERYQHLSELYHAQEKRLFKLLKRVKGPEFDKYSHTPLQAIDFLESVFFGDSEDDARAAMLQAGNSPVIPDGYVMVPMRLTAENGAKAALLGEFNLEYSLTCHECFGEGCDDCSREGAWTNTIPIDWTTIKKIWAKGVEHFAAAPQEVKGE